MKCEMAPTLSVPRLAAREIRTPGLYKRHFVDGSFEVYLVTVAVLGYGPYFFTCIKGLAGGVGRTFHPEYFLPNALQFEFFAIGEYVKLIQE